MRVYTESVLNPAPPGFPLPRALQLSLRLEYHVFPDKHLFTLSALDSVSL